ncbi:hypothetical protein SKAU_G00236050 [Synaphobranchus kaupii]|uniref:Uncharacterized protein n=1 Tax=Synaphobranchus kaupii TaxID=118154 RepID=A0A9Q1F6M6_SYNKA|nr:hypothetical protein SKAU_G00236050 [Synaphobranchus kaupii]
MMAQNILRHYVAVDQALIQAATKETMVGIFIIRKQYVSDELEDIRIVFMDLTVQLDLDSVAPGEFWGRMRMQRPAAVAWLKQVSPACLTEEEGSGVREEDYLNERDGNPSRIPLPSIILANARSLRNKTDKLQAHVRYQHEFKGACILALTETWLEERDSDCELVMDGFGASPRTDWEAAITGNREHRLRTDPTDCAETTVAVSRCS